MCRELVATTAFRIGALRLERSVKERMSLIQRNTDFNWRTINARPIMDPSMNSLEPRSYPHFRPDKSTLRNRQS